MLPIEEIEAGLYSAIDGGGERFVVSAPTGSGKSTALPVMLQRKLGGRVIVLQPRRVAARMLAFSIEKLFGMRGEVGWHIRFDKHYNERTKIIFLTEGILARMLLSDSLPDDVSAVVFDEFHERNIYADISLALALKLQKKRGAKLRLFACSASMESEALARYMSARIFSCSSRMFPIDIRYSPLAGKGLAVWDCAAREFARTASESGGNILVFMAGVYEIHKTVSRILETPQARGMQVLSLYGDMPAQMQDKILNDSDSRKVIVCTNIAETSLTIGGVDTVIDSGFAKVARYDFARGVNTLLVERISLANAAQRAGRAGRTRAGTVIRLWREADERSFARFPTSEISRIDLSQTMLWLKAAGADFDSLDFFEAPPEKSVEAARKTLLLLGAVDAEGRITPLGRKMARFPCSPRLARMFVDAAARGCLADAAMLAGTVEAGRIKLDAPDERRERERAEFASAESEPEEIMALCAAAKQNSFSQKFCSEFGIHAVNARKAFVYAADFRRLARGCLDAERESAEENALAKCVLAAFPDRVGVRLNKGTLACRMAGGVGGEIRKASKRYAPDAGSVFVAMSLMQTNSAAGAAVSASDIFPISRDCLREVFPEKFSVKTSAGFDEIQKRVCSVTEEIFGDLPLSKKISYDVSPDEAADLLYSKIADGGIVLKNFGDAERWFIERVNFVSRAAPELEIPPIDADALEAVFRQMCAGCVSYSEVRNADVMAALRDWLSAGQLAAVESFAPQFVEISPRRRPVRIRYDSSAMRAVVAASFKDLFSFNQNSLKICGGRIKPTFEILAPNSRPVQTTQDLAAFWKTSWQAVRKELKARYPKHFKPTDPY